VEKLVSRASDLIA
jgi:hypothetical protein